MSMPVCTTYYSNLDETMILLTKANQSWNLQRGIQSLSNICPTWKILRTSKCNQDGEPILGFEEHISTTLWELRNSKPIISFELGEPSAKAAHKNQYPFLSLCWSQILSCSELKCDFFKSFFSVSKLFKYWGHPLSSISLAPLFQLLQLVKEVISIPESPPVLLACVAWSKN